MKRFFFFTLAIACAFALRAQDCKSNLYMTPNAKLQMTVYDKKGKESGVQTIQVTGVKNNGAAYESTVSTSMVDDKGKAISNGTGTYRCNGGVLSADMKLFMPQEGMGGMKNAEASFEPVYLEYPSTLSVGQKLTDAELKMDMTMNGGMKASLTFKEENRTVTAKESVTSPAGTWDAYVISYEGNIKSKMGGIGLPAFGFTVKEWFVPGTGIVKSETYTKNGKLAGSTLLTAVTK